MNSIASVFARIPLFKLYRRFDWPKLLPLNLTLSPSPKCNSRCLTCNIWVKREHELTLSEWEKVLASLGRAPYWITISGGEPLMYPHIVQLVQSAYEQCQPGIINIPTNGILSCITDRVEAIARGCPQSQLIINLSLDGIGNKHDFIRGISGNFKKFEQRLTELLSLRRLLNNLTVGIHSVISTFNVKDIDEIIAYADSSGADQFITEIAEPRMELDTVNLPIMPSFEDYSKAIDRVIAYVDGKRFTGMARITELLRSEYYRLVKRILQENDQVIDCYAGWISAQIYADGTVWPCCVRADNLGNLRDHGYDFKRVWFGEKIREARRSIAAKECHCPLANASYTNMLQNIRTLGRVGANLLGLRPKAKRSSAIASAEERHDTSSTTHQISVGTQPASYDWLNTFQHRVEKENNYSEKTLAAYALALKAKGAISGVMVEPGRDCCDAARRLAAGKVYMPSNAPRLPLPDCTQGGHCGCVYRPAMKY